MLTVAVTGHRPEKLGGYGETERMRLETFAKIIVGNLQSYGNVVEIITGMAQGWDQAIATACRDLGMPYVAAVPFEGQERVWPYEAKERYQVLLSCAKRVVHVYSWNGAQELGYSVAQMMHGRNVWMVDRAAELHALWDGTKGGTSHCCGYAISKKVHTYNWWPEWERFNHD